MLGGHRRVLRKTAVLRVLLGLALYLVSIGPVHAAPVPRVDHGRRSGTHQVLSVLEREVGDPALLDRARRKLSALDEREVRLLATLARRIDRSGPTLAADVALFLLAALLVLG